jgi:AraC-like DNA-binding protein
MLSSRNYAPAQRLLPFVRRFYMFDATLPENFELEDILFSDNAFLRVLLKGDWAYLDPDGNWTSISGALVFGANSRAVRVRVKGPFSVASFAVRPSAWPALFATPAADIADRIVPLNTLWDDDIAAPVATDVLKAKTDSEQVALMTLAIEQQLARIGVNQIDPIVAAFEAIARNDSTARVEEAAKLLGLSSRQLERRCLAGFGLSPKAVLQRCRFLDMASAMRGLSDADESELAALRYFDQSHLNREFRRYTSMTPGAFQRTATPLFTASLKLRVDGKTLA